MAATLNCDVNAIQSTLCSLGSQVQSVGNVVGLSGQQIISAIQAGNASLASQLASCCCDVKGAITTQGYENRLATIDQTATIVGKIDAQTQTMLTSFQGIKDYLTAEKIESLQHTVTQMENAASNANQTLAFRAAIDAATTPIYNQVNALVGRVPPAPVPAYPAPQYATGYAFGVIPTTNCNATWTNNCGCGCGGAYEAGRGRR